MRVLHVAAELYPFVKTGGLGDVIAALPPALARSGADVRLLLPGFPALTSGLEMLEALPRGPGGVVALRRGRVPGSGLPVYLVDAPELFDRPGSPYLGPDGRDWPDNHRRFAHLGQVAAALAAGDGDPDWRPDLVHAHDWHAALAPAYLRARNCPAVAVLTIHNLAFQGLFPPQAFPDLNLPNSFFVVDGVEYYGQVSFMKAGIQFADRITTVSPTYAREIQTPAFGFGLEGLLQSRRSCLSGILNGVDYGVWNPETDEGLPRPFDVSDLSGKSEARAALRRRLGLSPDPAGPVFGAVTRLTEQKGFDLVLNVLPEILRAGGQLAILGSGDEALEREFLAAAGRSPEQVAVRIGFDEPLAHAIIGGSDVMMVPSRFEPCGLTQLYALRYGTIPLVHRVGGLADTVVDADEAGLADGTATGIVFAEPAVPGLLGAIHRVNRLHARPEVWRALQRQAMQARFGWDDAARSYLDLYRTALDERDQPKAVG